MLRPGPGRLRLLPLRLLPLLLGSLRGDGLTATRPVVAIGVDAAVAPRAGVVVAAELGEAPYGGSHFAALFFMGCVLFLITLVINLIVDLLYFVVDPRLRTAGGNARVGGH